MHFYTITASKAAPERVGGPPKAVEVLPLLINADDYRFYNSPEMKERS